MDSLIDPGRRRPRLGLVRSLAPVSPPPPPPQAIPISARPAASKIRTQLRVYATIDACTFSLVL